MFYLFYLQVEPVFYLRTIKSYPNHFCVINIGNNLKCMKISYLKIFSYVILKIFLHGLFLNSFSQNCECARMQYLEHYVCSGIELV